LYFMSKKTRRSKPYAIRIGDKAPHCVPAADWQRYRRMGLIEPTVNNGQPSTRVAQLCVGVVAWLERGMIVLQNLLTRVTAYVRTSWTAIERNAPHVVSEETLHYWHCLTDQQRAAWDAWRASLSYDQRAKSLF